MMFERSTRSSGSSRGNDARGSATSAARTHRWRAIELAIAIRSRRGVRAAVTIAVEGVDSDIHARATFFAANCPGVAMGRETDMVLYQAEWCPYCARVRKKMTDLLLDYKVVNVPHSHAERDVVKAVSGQTSIPVLVDGEVVLDDDDDIIPYLDKRYGRAASA